jgi:hypothetical protein
MGIKTPLLAATNPQKKNTEIIVAKAELLETDFCCSILIF